MSLLRLAGCAIGAALGTWGLPFLDAAFGLHAVRLALIWDLANIIAGASVLTRTPASKASCLCAASILSCRQRNYCVSSFQSHVSGQAFLRLLTAR